MSWLTRIIPGSSNTARLRDSLNSRSRRAKIDIRKRRDDELFSGENETKVAPGCDADSAQLYSGNATRRLNERREEDTMPVTINVNGASRTIDAEPDTPLLWALRDHLQLTGTKFGCGMALCGACTVHVDGAPVRSCVTPLASIAGKRVTTIEGAESRTAKAVQAAWEEHAVPQCGYCQSGQIMSAAALLETNPRPTDADIDAAMSGNICRCATYVRIRAAIKSAAARLA
jgi:isoquinoline 1-oxidoreductase subunit alpha